MHLRDLKIGVKPRSFRCRHQHIFGNVFVVPQTRIDLGIDGKDNNFERKETISDIMKLFANHSSSLTGIMRINIIF